MGPPRRTQAEINYNMSQQLAGMMLNQQHSISDQQSPPQHPPNSQPAAKANGGMSAASRYTHNLKVLRRRDSSIMSIIDQFTHVCVYHHNGQKWEKHGFEGSMFLYERNTYPPYGFYILNRVGMDDYIQNLYPEDDIAELRGILMIRSHPDFTAKRLARIRASLHDTSDRFSDVFALPDKLDGKDERQSSTVGLWYFAMAENREPMIDVMLRLHSYIKKNLPYPEEYRYGPDRPPPPNPNPQPTKSSKHRHTNSTISDTNQESQSDSDHGGSKVENPNRNSMSSYGDISEIDRLFAKLGPSTSASVTGTAAPTKTSSMTVESLFAALGGTDLAKTCYTSPEHVHTTQASSSTTGISLLDSIFASATNNSTPTHSPSDSFHTEKTALMNHALQRPTEPILHNNNRGHSTHVSGFEADDDHGKQSSDSDGGYSESSTVLDPEAGEELQAAGASAGRPLFAYPRVDDLRTRRREVDGDVTPRAPPSNGLFDNVQSSWPGSHTHDVRDADVDDIVELDFADTSALSDMEQFGRVMRAKKEKTLSGEAQSETEGRERAGGRGKKRERKRKEKEPTPQKPQLIGNGHSTRRDTIRNPVTNTVFNTGFNPDSPPASPSPEPPEPGASNYLNISTPPYKTVSLPNGTATPTSKRVRNGRPGNTSTRDEQAVRSLFSPKVQGNTKQQSIPLDANTLSQSVVMALDSPRKNQIRASVDLGDEDKSMIVEEVIRLLHTDRSFVDRLCEDYARKIGV